MPDKDVRQYQFQLCEETLRHLNMLKGFLQFPVSSKIRTVGDLTVFHRRNMLYIMWEVEYTDDFKIWWDTLTWEEQAVIDSGVSLIEKLGPSLPFPYSCQVKQSKHGNMRELRSQCAGKPYRTFYAFDPKRTAILLIGGDKTGDDRFYEVMVPKADKIYDNYLKEIKEEQ